jgi:hypothetical protein
MNIRLGKRYLLEIDRKLVEVEIEEISTQSYFKCKLSEICSFWLSFWGIYSIVKEEI